jgi:hypothetical protein
MPAAAITCGDSRELPSRLRRDRVHDPRERTLFLFVRLAEAQFFAVALQVMRADVAPMAARLPPPARISRRLAALPLAG